MRKIEIGIHKMQQRNALILSLSKDAPPVLQRFPPNLGDGRG
jgi:hypothetical protein